MCIKNWTGIKTFAEKPLRSLCLTVCTLIWISFLKQSEKYIILKKGRSEFFSAPEFFFVKKSKFLGKPKKKFSPPMARGWEDEAAPLRENNLKTKKKKNGSGGH